MIGTEPTDTISPPDAKLAEPASETANPDRELTVRAAPRTVDQRRLIWRDSGSPLDPRPDSPVRCGSGQRSYLSAAVALCSGMLLSIETRVASASSALSSPPCVNKAW
jgi:hypothetical protein